MKVCSNCHIEKEDSDFRFEKQWNRLRSWCRQCDKEAGEIQRRKKGIKPQHRRPPDLLPDFKYCTHCGIEKLNEDFRVRVERRGSNFRYLNSTCKKCDTEIAKENYRINRQTEAGRKRNCEWSRKAYKNRREKAIAHMKQKRNTPEYKAYMKTYRQNRKEIIYQQEVVTKRRYHENNRDSISDQYVFNLLRSQGLFGKDEKENVFNCSPLIEAKRKQLLIIRKIKNHVNTN